jgi:RNA-directed DNA polymerase
MNSLQYEKKQFGYLCSLIKCSPEGLRNILGLIGEQYIEWEEPKKNKATNVLKTYLDGTPKKRILRPPKYELKRIQRSINRNILSNIKLESVVYGGVKGKSNINNAKRHQGKKYVFTTDLLDFYPSISSSQVYQLFRSLGFSNHASRWLTKLTTFKNQLPQGAPTSALLANLIFKDADLMLIALAKTHSLTYTRFVDDLTFSSSSDFKAILPEILDTIQRFGFRVNYRKTHYNGHQNITGIKVRNNFIDVPKEIKMKAQIEISQGLTNGPYTQYIERVQGTNN